MRFEANTSKFFAVSDGLVVLSACSDAKMSRSGDFCANDNRQTQPMTLPLGHARKVMHWFSRTQ